MKCANCGRGRPRLWAEGLGFCDEFCRREWKRKRQEAFEEKAARSIDIDPIDIDHEH